MRALVVSGVVAFAACLLSASPVELNWKGAKCVVETVGARVVSYVPAGGEEVIWNAEPMQLKEPKWAHGGIPLCWPWFGVNGKAGIHGTAWREEFAVVSKEEGKNWSSLVLVREENGIRLEFAVRLKDTLKIDLKTVNNSDKDFSFYAGFHPYFRVGDVEKCFVGGVKDPVMKKFVAGEDIFLDKPIDDAFPASPASCSIYRLGDPVLDRTIFVFAENSHRVNIWNPGAPMDTVGYIPGDGWKTFACVEPIAGSRKEPVVLKAGGNCWVLMMGIDVRKGSKRNGYIGNDPRRPGAAEIPTGRPFHVLYLGAHPDDLDFDMGAPIVKLIQAGAKVTGVTFTNGDKGHVTMAPKDLAARRRQEAQASARTLGLERYTVQECSDCEVEPSCEWRERIGRLIRNVAPDVVLTHRNVDYHADHRAVGTIVQDATYFLGVPHWCPDTPVPEKLPFFMYVQDSFTLPRVIRADLVMSARGGIETAAKALSCHSSQLFEWLPPENGDDPADLKSPEAQWKLALAETKGHHIGYGRHHRQLLKELYGDENEPVSIAELSEYARKPTLAEIDFLKSIDGFKWNVK